MADKTKLFVKNTHRFDPYRNFRFLVSWDNKVVAGLSKMSGLKRTTESVEWREGGENAIVHKLPGKTKYEGITLEQGLSHDPAFRQWAYAVSHPQGDAAMALKNFRKTVRVEVLNEQGIPALAYVLHNCWVSEFQAVGDLDASANAVAIQTIKLECDWWEQDLELQEPEETEGR